MRISDAQVVDLIQRRNLDPDDPKYLSGESFQAYLRGQLVPREVLDADAKIVDISGKVDLLIKAGYHKVTNGGEGMKASQYRKLWPKTVTVPPEYVGRFDEILLVDRSIKVVDLVKAGNLYLSVKPEDSEDMVKPPLGEEGQPLTRYIAFVQLGEKNLGRSVEDCRSSFAEDEMGLVSLEGFHLPVQHENHLRRFAIDLPGSRFGCVYAPCVYWFDVERPSFNASRVQNRHGEYGSASRGSVVIKVT